jgi:hypothetical protein
VWYKGCTYSSDDIGDKCVALCNFKDRMLVVIIKDCGAQCGLNAAGTMDGTYTVK